MSDTPPLIVPGPVAIPSDRLWFDPLLLAVATSVQTHIVSTPLNGNVLMAQQNARRWGLGIFPAGGLATYQIAPWPDVDKYSWFSQTGNTVLPFYTLFQIGSMVSNAWYITSTTNTTFRVVELLRN